MTTTQGTTSTHRLVADLFRAMADGAEADLARLVHPQAHDREAVIGPPAARTPGPAGWWASTAWLRAAFTDLSWELHEILVDGDLAAVHTTMSGRHTGTYHRYGPDGAVVAVRPPTGRPFAVTQTHWFRTADGLLVEHWANRDDLGLAGRLGWLGAPGGSAPAAAARRMDVGDAELEYWERGADAPGPAVLLAHAGMFGEWFRPVFDQPALDGLRVVRVHRAGYGASSRPTGPLSLADHARQCCALLRGLGIERAVWVGHSSSACIGLQAALDHPDLVEGLVLLEPAPQPAGPSAEETNARVVGPVMAALADGDVARAADLFLRGVDGLDYRALLRARLGEDAPDRLTRDAAYFLTDEVRAAAVDWRFDAATAAGVRARTLLVTGAESRRVTPMFAEAVALLADWLPAADTVELPGVGHGMPLQDPVAVARLVADFVRA